MSSICIIKREKNCSDSEMKPLNRASVLQHVNVSTVREQHAEKLPENCSSKYSE